MNKQSRRVSKLPHDVYRVYDAHGTLLYVGCSVNVFDRMKAHRQYADWWADAAIGTVHRYPNRSHALSIEARAILRERPTANRVVEAWRASQEANANRVVEPAIFLEWDEGEVWVSGEDQDDQARVLG